MLSQYKTVAPVGERVLVKIDVSDEKSIGGILLPSSAQKKPTQGHVEKAGTAKAVKVRCMHADLCCGRTSLPCLICDE
jgi:chaperonin GroES